MSVEPWSNWSGSVRFRPASTSAPSNESAVVTAVQQAILQGQTIRAIGAGHSSSAILPTEGTLLSFDHLSGLRSVDRTHCEAWVFAGTKLKELGELLVKEGLAMPNLGDVDQQAVAGAMSTGTHGTGREFGILADSIIGVRLVDGTGALVEFTDDQASDVIRAAQVSLGTLGIFTALKLRLIPALQLRLRQWCASIDDCLAHLDELIAAYRNFDFYWYPRRDETKLRTWHPASENSPELPFAQCIDDQTDWSAKVLSLHSGIDLKFEEMEYILPAEAGPACFREVRERVLKRHRKLVGWRVLYRTIAASEAMLSPTYGRPSVAISLHQNASLPYWDYFRDLEPVFLAYGGRPHWGKKYTLNVAQLQSLYPEWNAFNRIRQQLDPKGIFLNEHLRDLFAGKR